MIVPPEQMAAARESEVYALRDTVTAAVPVMGDAVSFHIFGEIWLSYA